MLEHLGLNVAMITLTLHEFKLLSRLCVGHFIHHWPTKLNVRPIIMGHISFLGAHFCLISITTGPITYHKHRLIFVNIIIRQHPIFTMIGDFNILWLINNSNLKEFKYLLMWSTINTWHINSNATLIYIYSYYSKMGG